MPFTTLLILAHFISNTKFKGNNTFACSSCAHPLALESEFYRDADDYIRVKNIAGEVTILQPDPQEKGDMILR